MEVQQNDIVNEQGRSLAFSSDVGTAYAQRGDFNNKGFSVFYAMEKSVIFK